MGRGPLAQDRVPPGSTSGAGNPRAIYHRFNGQNVADTELIWKLSDIPRELRTSPPKPKGDQVPQKEEQQDNAADFEGGIYALLSGHAQNLHDDSIIVATVGEGKWAKRTCQKEVWEDTWKDTKLTSQGRAIKEDKKTINRVMLLTVLIF